MPSNALSTMAPPEGEQPPDESQTGGRGWSTRKRQVVIVAVALAALALLVALLGGNGSSGSKTGGGRSTNAGSANSAGNGATGADAAQAGGTGAAAGQSSGKAGARPNPNGLQISPGMPLTVSVSDTSHLKDGDNVSIHVVAKPGSAVYGFEARQCAIGVVYNDDALQRPTLGGNCAAQAVSSRSQPYGEFLSDPPNKSVDGAFRVGVGSNTFTTRYGRTVTITCGPGHPCMLVLKLQFPNDYGFEAIPLRFT